MHDWHFINITKLGEKNTTILWKVKILSSCERAFNATLVCDSVTLLREKQKTLCVTRNMG
jgi:hypothetical protein